MLACFCIFCLNLFISLSLFLPPSLLLSLPSSHSCSLFLVLDSAFLWVSYILRLSQIIKKKMASCSSKPNNLTKEVRFPFTPIHGGTLSGSECHPLLRPVSTKWYGVTYDWLGLVACALGVESQPTVGSLTDGPPESYGVKKGQFYTNTTQVHKNDWSLHKHVLIINYWSVFSLSLSKPAHSGAPVSFYLAVNYRKESDVN